jgi:hypothetical protein
LVVVGFIARRFCKGAAGFLFKIMSLLSDFLTSAHSVFQTVTGTDSVTIGGGAAILGKLGEAQFSRDFESGGFEQEGSLEFVTSLAQFVASYPLAARTYEGRKATARGENWRVKSVNIGGNFVRISLGTTNKSS